MACIAGCVLLSGQRVQVEREQQVQQPLACRRSSCLASTAVLSILRTSTCRGCSKWAGMDATKPRGRLTGYNNLEVQSSAAAVHGLTPDRCRKVRQAVFCMLPGSTSTQVGACLSPLQWRVGCKPPHSMAAGNA